MITSMPKLYNRFRRFTISTNKKVIFFSHGSSAQAAENYGEE